LGRHVLAHLKAVAEGVSPIAAARNYLAVDEDGAGAAHEAAAQSAIMIARRAGLGPRWRLLRLDLTAQPAPNGTAAGMPEPPSIDDWAADGGLEDWPAAELEVLYAEAFALDKSPGHRRKIAQLERLRQARMALLDRLAAFTTEAPRPSDPVGGWFSMDLATRLDAAGFTTLGQLREEIALRGRWWRKIPAFGPTKAARLAEDLHALMGPSSIVRSAPAGSAGAATSHSWQDLAVLPSDAAETIGTWIRHRTQSPATARAYRREAERFVVWLRVERERDLVTTTADDCAAFIAFLAAVPRDWISRQRAVRASADWAPFAGQPSVTSQRFTLTVLESFFAWMTADSRVSRNAWLSVNRRLRDDPAAIPQEASRAFSVEAWAALVAHADGLAGPAGQRMQWLLCFVQATGLRSAELLGARCSDLYEQDDGTWLHVHGKGGKNRSVPVPLAALKATERYFRARGLELGAAHGRTPLLAGLTEPRLPGDNLTLAFDPPDDQIDPAALARAEHAARGGITYSTLQAVFRRFVVTALASSALTEAQRAHAARATAHWLRHTHATRAAEAAVPIDVLQANLGQADPRTTAIYYRAQQRRRRDAIERVFG
jgi:integrase